MTGTTQWINVHEVNTNICGMCELTEIEDIGIPRDAVDPYLTEIFNRNDNTILLCGGCAEEIMAVAATHPDLVFNEVVK